MCCGTCSDSCLGRPVVPVGVVLGLVVAEMGVGMVGMFGMRKGESSLAELAVAGGVSSRADSGNAERVRSLTGPSLVLGFAGNVTKGPSLTERLVGGRPRSLPLGVVLLLGQADETAVPCLRRMRIL